MRGQSFSIDLAEISNVNAFSASKNLVTEGNQIIQPIENNIEINSNYSTEIKEFLSNFKTITQEKKTGILISTIKN